MNFDHTEPPPATPTAIATEHRLILRIVVTIGLVCLAAVALAS